MRSPLKSLRLPALLATVLLLAVPPDLLRAQPACSSSTVEDAGDAYAFGRFDQTLVLLRPCRDRPTAEASRLLALTYIATDSLQLARSWTQQLLRTNVRFRPDPAADPPQFVAYVDDLKPNWYSWLWKGRAWYHWAGRAAIVGAAVAVPLLLRSEPLPDLPGPPGLPG